MPHPSLPRSTADISSPEVSSLASRLLAWYASHARQLPWRGVQDPYATWISEIMLQQTRVETVIPYYQRWMQRFPTLADLAGADLQQVLGVWEGLGYYSRARSLHRAARLVMQEYNGTLPRDMRKLRQLPGVGRYTAAAIASIAFGCDEAALDGNIRRVLARCFNISEDARSVVGEQLLWQLANENLPAGRAGDYNQAMMDLGANLCTPKSPACLQCPLEDICQARALGVQEQRPVRLPRPAIPHLAVTAAVIQRDGKVLIACRPPHGLLGGLWEFPGGKQQDGEDLIACLKREICEELGVEIAVGAQLGIYHHAYTHYRVTLFTYLCTLLEGEPRPIQEADVRWVLPIELENFPMGKLDRQISLNLITG